jgi:hypothetical protein
MDQAVNNALGILRSTHTANWSLAIIMCVIFYVYAVEAGRKNWYLFLFSIGWLAVELMVLELPNSLLIHFSNGTKFLWLSSTNTNYLFMAGINIEIFMSLALGTLAFLKLLPEDKELKIWGIPNRYLFVVGASFACFLAEQIWNQTGLLLYHFTYWPIVVFFGYWIIWYLIVWFYDTLKEKLTLKQMVITAGGLVVIEVITFVIFGVILEWI